MVYSLIDAFAYLESVGIWHRDIKPTNLFLLENFQIKIPYSTGLSGPRGYTVPV